MRLDQRDPTPVAVDKAIASLVAGLNARHPGQRWRVSSPPDRLEDRGAMRPRNVDRPRVVGPDDQRPVDDVRPTRPTTNEDVTDHPAKKVA